MIGDFLDEKNDSFDISNAIDDDNVKEDNVREIVKKDRELVKEDNVKEDRELVKEDKNGGRSINKAKNIKKAKKGKKLTKEGKKLAKHTKIDGAFLEYKEILNEFATLSSYIGGKLEDPHINFSDITDVDIYERNEFSGKGERDLETEESAKEFSINDAI